MAKARNNRKRRCPSDESEYEGSPAPSTADSTAALAARLQALEKTPQRTLKKRATKKCMQPLKMRV